MVSKTGIWAVFRRECYRIACSKICIWGIFAAPILTLIIMLWMMNAGLPSRIPIAVVDLDNTVTSRTLVRQLDAFEKTDVRYKCLSFDAGIKLMERGDAYAVLCIPHNFTKDAIAGKRPTLNYYTNNAFLISGSLLFQDLKTVSTLASASVGLQTAEAHGFTEKQIMPVLMPISVEAHPIGNPWLNYSVYLNNMIIPGILQLIIFMFTVSALGSEIKNGTARQLLALGGHSMTKTLIGKLLPYTIIYLILSLLFMSILYYYLHFPLHCGFLPMFIDYICLILAGQGFGVILFSLFRNYRFALSIASLLGMVSFSITGFSYSAPAMYPAIHGLSYIFPLRHFFLVYVDQALNGISTGYSAYHYVGLLVFALIGLLCMKPLKNYMERNEYEI